MYEHEFCETGLCKADISPVIECSGSDSCEAELSCVDGKCLSGCTETCAEGFACEFGFCHQLVFCLASADCADGDACMDGSCQAPLN